LYILISDGSLKLVAVVADASGLILLSKIRRLHLLRDLYGKVLIGPVVKHEVVDRGREISARGVEFVEQAIHDGWVRVAGTAPSPRVKAAVDSSRLDPGEKEAIALAARRNTVLIADDKEARYFADALGLRYIGTAGILLFAYRRRLLTLPEFEAAVRDLAAVSWLAPEVVATVLKLAREGSSK
jgi:predicted nucleic acid-binding protein